MSPPGTFGELLRRHRIAAGLSQEELAVKARVSVETIGALERGVRRAPYRPTVDLLSSALSLSDEERSALEAAIARARPRNAAAIRNAEKALPATNLARPESTFIGREDALDHLAVALACHRLVTITGSGGVGKTRTAIEAGTRYLAVNDVEVWFVDLAALSSGELIAAKIASSVRPPLAGSFDDVESLAAAFISRRALLVLDNCEHIVADVARVARALLEACPGISILATSREPLNVEEELVYRLPSLTLPPLAPTNPDQVRAYESVALFIERAGEVRSSVVDVDPTFENVVDICRRLDGIPLALELAAARLPLLGLSTLRDRLEESLSLAFRGHAVVQRQQTMLATIQWSYDLLSDDERILLRRLSIFTGGCTLQAAESVCGEPPLHRSAILPLLFSLIEKSLVTVEHAREKQARYSLLESLRAFGLSRLREAGEVTSTARSHARWIADMADGMRPSNLAETTNVETVVRDLDNVRAAIAWCRNAPSPEDRSLIARIFLGLRGLWVLSGRYEEPVTIARDALATMDQDRHPRDAAMLLGVIVSRSWAEPDCRAVIASATSVYERLGDRNLLAQFYSMMVFVYAKLGDLGAAERAEERATAIMTAENMKDTLSYADLIASRSVLRGAQRRWNDARSDLAAATAIAGRLGNDFYVAAMCLPRRAEIELKAGNYNAAISLAEEMLSCEVPAVQEMVTGEALGFLACLRLHTGEIDAAERAARRQLEFGRGDDTMAIEYLATVAALRGDVRRAARLKGFIDARLARSPMIGLVHQRTATLLAASLDEQLSPEAIALEASRGARYTLAQATIEALAGAGHSSPSH